MKKTTILVVNAHSKQRKLIADQLLTLDYCVLKCSSGTEALKVVRQNPQLDFVITATDMGRDNEINPPDNGIILLRALQKLSIQPTVLLHHDSGNYTQPGDKQPYIIASWVTAFIPFGHFMKRSPTDSDFLEQICAWLAEQARQAAWL